MKKYNLNSTSRLVNAFVKENRQKKPKHKTSICDDTRIAIKKSNGYAPYTIPKMVPVSYYDDIPQFTVEQYEWYHDKLPERYEIIDNEPDYSYEVPFSKSNTGIEWTKTRPVHYYYVKDRFKFTLCQLMGVAGDVPYHILCLFDKIEIRQVPKDKLWNYIRAILKTNGARLYYNRIPSIVLMLGLAKPRFMQQEQILTAILKEFDEMVISWKTIKDKFNRTYFINLRYVSLRLLSKYGIVFPYHVPLARMDKSVMFLGKVYDELLFDIEQRKLIDDIAALLDE